VTEEPAEHPDSASDETGYAATLATMQTVLARRFGVEISEFDDDMELARLGLDSLGFVEYVFELETALQIALPDVPRHIEKLGEFARYIHAEVVKQAGMSSQ
jgi:acyl carrier protein